MCEHYTVFWICNIFLTPLVSLVVTNPVIYGTDLAGSLIMDDMLVSCILI